MRFSVQLPTDQVRDGAEFISAKAIGAMARAAEDVGFDSCFVTDHPIPGERWLKAGGHHSLDPFVALAFAAATTERIRLQTHVLILPYRNPFIAAKAAASLDVASGGRLILGVATGYLKPEFAAVGADIESRNEVTDEAISVFKRIWSEDDVKLVGRGFEAVGNTAYPQPLQQPHPPLWIGGNSRRAIHRAVEHGDAWVPFPAPRDLATHTRTAALQSLDDLRERISYLNAYASEFGRKIPPEICFIPFGMDAVSRGEAKPGSLIDELHELESMGVNWSCVMLPAKSRQKYIDTLGDFRDEVLVRFTSE